MNNGTLTISSIVEELTQVFGNHGFTVQETQDNIPTVWVPASKIVEIARHYKNHPQNPYRMLHDITAIDERMRKNRMGQPESDYTVVYFLFSLESNSYLRLKVALKGDNPSLPSITGLWPNANWYEREVFDMFGVKFDGHPHMYRILMPRYWKGHPLRKEHPARATEMGPYFLNPEKEDFELNQLTFKPEEWGLKSESDDVQYMFLNVGPQHPGTHGVLRLIVQLEGEEIVDVVPDIGFHHRGAEKMAERQTWHTFIPYTDRIDYLAGVINNHAYLLSVEKLAGIEIPPRAQVIRIMMNEFFRIASHLVWYGTFAQDIGQISPVFYMFTDRERVFEIVEAVTGGHYL